MERQSHNHPGSRSWITEGLPEAKEHKSQGDFLGWRNVVKQKPVLCRQYLLLPFYPVTPVIKFYDTFIREEYLKISSALQ